MWQPWYSAQVECTPCLYAQNDPSYCSCSLSQCSSFALHSTLEASHAAFNSCHLSSLYSAKVTRVSNHWSRSVSIYGCSSVVHYEFIFVAARVGLQFGLDAGSSFKKASGPPQWAHTSFLMRNKFLFFKPPDCSMKYRATATRRHLLHPSCQQHVSNTTNKTEQSLRTDLANTTQHGRCNEMKTTTAAHNKKTTQPSLTQRTIRTAPATGVAQSQNVAHDT